MQYPQAADSVLILKDGSIAAFGDPKDILNDEDSIKVITQMERENKEKESEEQEQVSVTHHNRSMLSKLFIWNALHVESIVLCFLLIL